MVRNVMLAVSSLIAENHGFQRHGFSTTFVLKRFLLRLQLPVVSLGKTASLADAELSCSRTRQ